MRNMTVILRFPRKTNLDGRVASIAIRLSAFRINQYCAIFPVVAQAFSARFLPLFSAVVEYVLSG